MLFNSPLFVLVSVFSIVCWYVLPNVLKKPALLIYSYYFAYLLGGIWTVATLLVVTVFTYALSLVLEHANHKKYFFIAGMLLLVSVIIYNKYFSYIFSHMAEFTSSNANEVSVLAMVGVSYYVFSAISYLVDIYNSKDVVDKNLLDVALWLALYTKFIAGPIERHNEFKRELNNVKKISIDFEHIKRGMLICALGYFYKIIIADRAAIFVDNIWSNLSLYSGITLVLAAVIYSLQIYFDFAGYSLIAYGISYAMGIRIARNFNHPYLSDSVSDFWRRWHISLSHWLRDYVYIPLGGNRKGKIRQYTNLMITFLVSGLWHGAGFKYLIWGALHGFFQLMEKIFPFRQNISKKCNVIITFVLVSFAWIFFRAPSLGIALVFIRKICVWNPWVLTDGTLVNQEFDLKEWIVFGVSLGIALIIEIIQESSVSIYQRLQSQGIIVRWIVYYSIIIVLLVFGIYGSIFDANNFIYFQY